MLDKTLQPVIIDFDSSQPLGVKLVGKSGTGGWCKETDYSGVENDTFGLGMTEEFLRRNVDTAQGEEAQ